jgi:hypothetical protein
LNRQDAKAAKKNRIEPPRPPRKTGLNRQGAKAAKET